MKIQYLGTAAAEGFPGMFCKCPVCEKSRKAGGRNIRTRSQAVIDGKLLIDFGPDTYMHHILYGTDLLSINNVLITHAHRDHFYPKDLDNRDSGYGYNEDGTAPAPLNVFISDESSKYAYEVPAVDNLIKEGVINIHIVEPYKSFTVDGYTVTPLRAKHGPGYGAVNYIISDGEKTLLYAHDTGYFYDEVFDYIKDNKIRFDFVSLDCTMILKGSKYHMGLELNAEVTARLREIGAVCDETKICVNHFSHNGGLTYDELVPVAAEKNFLVSFDGMTVEF